MPYKSEKQRAFMHANLPKVAEKWDRETGGVIVPGKKSTKSKPTKRTVRKPARGR